MFFARNTKAMLSILFASASLACGFREVDSLNSIDTAINKRASHSNGVVGTDAGSYAMALDSSMRRKSQSPTWTQCVQADQEAYVAREDEKLQLMVKSIMDSVNKNGEEDEPMMGNTPDGLWGSDMRLQLRKADYIVVETNPKGIWGKWDEHRRQECKADPRDLADFASQAEGCQLVTSNRMRFEELVRSHYVEALNAVKSYSKGQEIKTERWGRDYLDVEWRTSCGGCNVEATGSDRHTYACTRGFEFVADKCSNSGETMEEGTIYVESSNKYVPSAIKYGNPGKRWEDISYFRKVIPPWYGQATQRYTHKAPCETCAGEGKCACCGNYIRMVSKHCFFFEPSDKCIAERAACIASGTPEEDCPKIFEDQVCDESRKSRASCIGASETGSLTNKYGNKIKVYTYVTPLLPLDLF